jgi:asparaginyl-tRNA synthetase
MTVASPTLSSVKQALSGAIEAGSVVTVRGWVRTIRDAKGGLSFVNVTDGSCFDPIQAVVTDKLANYESEVKHLTTGAGVIVTGALAPSQGKGQRFEIQANTVEVTGFVDDPLTYPIQPKPHTMEFLREVAHLRPRTNVIAAATRVRHTLAQAIHRFFDQNGFFWVNTPIITSSDAEGAGALFRVSALDLANLPRTPQAKSTSRRISSATRRS